MLIYFKRIRKNLLDSGKVSRYLAYAVGEILLVVIGILIALQVNDWNEAEKREKMEIEFLRGLLVDLKQDSLNFSVKVKQYEVLVDRHRSYLIRAYDTQRSYEEYLEVVGLISWDSENFIAQNVTYSELLNSGNLNIFKNKDLKNQIISHYREYEKASKHITEFNEFSASFLARLPFGHSTFYSGIKPPEEVLRDPGQWGYINDPKTLRFLFNIQSASLYGDKHSVFKDVYYTDLLQRTSRLIEAIENELSIKMD
ncbi:DUF6090 family protein [Muriicola sp.]|uniref:DUF6090 family protein n=1 Tax=Muriicola sp. TaxID=2020856 RepID=UPI0035681637